MDKPYVIGISGGSASGKTTFANELEKRLKDKKIKVFHMDSYFKAESERNIVTSPIHNKQYRDDNHPASFHLNQLKQDLALALNESIDVILIEGLLTLYDNDIVQKLDLKLFIDCRADERIVRRLNRNMQRGLSFSEISDVYLDLVRFRHDEYVENSKWIADLIINGSQSFDLVINMIVTHIMQIKNSEFQ